VSAAKLYPSFLFFLLLLGLLWSCKTKPTTNPDNPLGDSQDSLSSFAPAWVDLKLEPVKVKKRLSCPDTVCTEVTVAYYRVIDDGYLRVNEMLEKLVNDRLADYVRKAKGTSTEALADEFLIDYQEFKEAFPESNLPWQLDIKSTISFSTTDFISLRVTEYAYTGGAHDNEALNYVNLKTTGEILKNYSDFFTSPDVLKNMAEQRFRDARNLTRTADLAEAGYMFENNEFQLSTNFGFNKQGLLIYYNAYEIAAYVQGPTEVLLTWEEISSLWKNNPS
jgi:hypothetical protein